MAGRLCSGCRRWSEPRTAIVVARLVFTVGHSRAFTALRLIDIVRAVHSHLNELAMLEFGLQQLARLEDELAPDGAVPGPLMLALSSRTRIGTVERANAIAAATLPAEAQRRLTVLPIEITTGYRWPDGQWPLRCPVAWPVAEFNARVASDVDAPDPHVGVSGPTSSPLPACRERAAEGPTRAAARRWWPQFRWSPPKAWAPSASSHTGSALSAMPEA
jgi:hypothetical protein